jgi:hypothetical protein
MFGKIIVISDPLLYRCPPSPKTTKESSEYNWSPEFEGI